MPDLEQSFYVKSLEAARRVGVSKRTIIRWVHNGAIPGRIIGRQCFVSRAALDRMQAEADAA